MIPQNQIPEPELRFRQIWLLLGWTLVLLVIYLSVTPSPMQLPVEQGDKLSHLFAYSVLMSWFANLYEVPAQRARFAISFIVLGIALEFVQRWTGYRSFEVTDMVSGAVGVAAGLVLAPPRIPNFLQMMEKLCRV